jgi:hypothetical protein
MRGVFLARSASSTRARLVCLAHEIGHRNAERLRQRLQLIHAGVLGPPDLDVPQRIGMHPHVVRHALRQLLPREPLAFPFLSYPYTKMHRAILLGPEVLIEDVIERPRAGRWEGGKRQSCFVAGVVATVMVGPRKYLGHVLPHPAIVFEEIAGLASMVAD